VHLTGPRTARDWRAAERDAAWENAADAVKVDVRAEQEAFAAREAGAWARRLVGPAVVTARDTALRRAAGRADVSAATEGAHADTIEAAIVTSV